MEIKPVNMGCGGISLDHYRRWIFICYFVELIDEIRQVKLDLEGKGDRMKVFDSNGNGNIGYRIYTIKKNPDQPQKLIYEEVSV